jgi:hypothetical protein
MAQASATLSAPSGAGAAIPYKRLALFLLSFFLVGAYTSFLTADVYSLYLEAIGAKTFAGSLYSRALKYSCVVLLFALTLLVGRTGHDRRDRGLLQVAMALVCVADLLIFRGRLVAGVCVFFFVQLALIARHARGFRLDRREIVSAIVIFGAIGGVFGWLVMPILPHHLLAPSLVYTLALIASVWIGIGTIWRTFYPRTVDWFIALGMVFFFLCDLNVGLAACFKEPGAVAPSWARFLVQPDAGLTRQTILDGSLLGRGFACLIWYFYLPALTLLCSSGYRLDFIRSIFPLIPNLPEPRPAAGRPGRGFAP